MLTFDGLEGFGRGRTGLRGQRVGRGPYMGQLHLQIGLLQSLVVTELTGVLDQNALGRRTLARAIRGRRVIYLMVEILQHW